MLGFAQKLFAENGCKLPAPAHRDTWPQLAAMFPYVDYAFAQHILNEIPDACEEVAALVAYLSFTAREGHLCIRIEPGSVFPDTRQFFEGTGSQKLSSLILQGVCQLPDSLLADVSSASLSECPHKPICRSGPLFYLQRYWRQESIVLERFAKIAKGSPALEINQNTIEDTLSTMLRGKILLPEQAAAIRSASKKTLTFICGGPGTGKTYTAGEMIKILWAAMPEAQQQTCEIALAAPTGKAAANLQMSLRRATKDIAGFPAIHAKTLHMLLGIKNSKSRKDILFLNADIILIDECSMIDARMMEELFGAIKPGARLVMLGDRHQLPPVAAGMLFSDLLQHPLASCIELKTCLRAELQAIVEFASAINGGDSDRALNLLSKSQSGLSYRHNLPSSANGYHKDLIDYALPIFLEAVKHGPEKAFEAFSKFGILSPLRQGPMGVDMLNALFAKRIMQHTKNEEIFIAPILLMANDHRQELSNGELGILVRHSAPQMDTAPQAGDYALFLSRDGSTHFRRIPALLLPRYEYAYCLSVHKSQGSEFERVLLLLPEGSERFGREVLYTAVTRARKHLELWGSETTLRATIAQKAERLSGIQHRSLTSPCPF